jgi:hypothetical protein
LCPGGHATIVRRKIENVTHVPGSARVSRAGEAVSDSGALVLGSRVKSNASAKDCFGATPKPARGTRALPNQRGFA